MSNECKHRPFSTGISYLYQYRNQASSFSWKSSSLSSSKVSSSSGWPNPDTQVSHVNGQNFRTLAMEQESPTVSQLSNLPLMRMFPIVSSQHRLHATGHCSYIFLHWHPGLKRGSVSSSQTRFFQSEIWFLESQQAGWLKYETGLFDRSGNLCWNMVSYSSSCISAMIEA